MEDYSSRTAWRDREKGASNILKSCFRNDAEAEAGIPNEQHQKMLAGWLGAQTHKLKIESYSN
jgi:hypothetical protein